MNQLDASNNGEKNSGRFKAGVSGNPAGRPKADTNIRDLARQYTQEALSILVAVARNPKASNTARVHASCAILDRGWGKPSMFIESVQIGLTYADYLDRTYSAHSGEIDEAYAQLTGEHYQEDAVQLIDVQAEPLADIAGSNLGDL